MRVSLAVFATLLVGAIVRAASIPAEEQPGWNAIREADLKANLGFLASDPLEGRMSLTRGSEVAIQWIESEFRKAGLQPGASGSYLQPVPLWEFRNDRSKSSLEITLQGRTEAYTFPEAYGQFPTDVDIRAPLVFAGFGITAPELSYDDYQHIDAKGKIVLIFDHEPQETDAKSIFNGRGNTRYATARVKVLNAQAHGAVAALVVAEPNRKHPSSQERIARVTGTNPHLTRLPSQAIEGDEVRIPYITVSDKVAARIIETTGAKAADVQQKIDQTLTPQSRDLPITASIHLRNSERRQGTSFNVAGLLAGSDPSLASETILITAHYDHDGADGTQVWHGADDNGSGTVGVAELTHAFTSNGNRPKRSLLFIVFAAEERGLLGSYYYVQHPLRALNTTRAVINFDMIGRDEAPSKQTDGFIEIAPDTSNET